MASHSKPARDCASQFRNSCDSSHKIATLTGLKYKFSQSTDWYFEGSNGMHTPALYSEFLKLQAEFIQGR
jgi:hypothetical protein